MRARYITFLLLAATALGPRGYCADDSLPALTLAVQSGRADKQAKALSELEALGLDAISAQSEVQSLLESRDWRLQANAARALAGMKKDAAPAIPKLVALLGTSDSPWIMTDVGGIPDPGYEAAKALAAIGTESVEPLISSLENRDRVVRFQAAFALGEIGPPAKKAVPALIKLLGDPEAVVRLQVTWALVRIAPDCEEAVDAVIARMKDEDESVRATTADVVKDIRPVSKKLIDTLIDALDDNEGLVQAHAARTLGTLGDKAAPAVPALTKMLTSRNGYPYPDGHPYSFRPVAEMAARTLGQIGAPARPALPALLDTIRDRRATFEDVGTPESNKDARAAAAEAAVRIDPHKRELVGVLQDALIADPQIRESVAWGLATMGTNAAPAHSQLVELLGSGDSQDLPLACAVLSVDPNNSQAFTTLLKGMRVGRPVGEQQWPVLAAILERYDPQGRQSISAVAEYLGRDHANDDIICAARTLARYGSKAAVTLNDLMILVDDAFAEVRCEAVGAMWSIAPVPQEFFRTEIKKTDVQTRMYIAEALKSLPESTPVLVEMLDDPSANVRFAAVSALDPSHVDERAIRAVRRLLTDQSRSIREAAESILTAK